MHSPARYLWTPDLDQRGANPLVKAAAPRSAPSTAGARAPRTPSSPRTARSCRRACGRRGTWTRR
ncbi:hypothetical protein [Clavibacter tessellarius]|uniref:hypothetical protein n=1 Tax=Clavibacter tessellarius TaxID=31965 RepID=UPI0039BFC076